MSLNEETKRNLISIVGHHKKNLIKKSKKKKKKTKKILKINTFPQNKLQWTLHNKIYWIDGYNRFYECTNVLTTVKEKKNIIITVLFGLVWTRTPTFRSPLTTTANFTYYIYIRIWCNGYRRRK